MDFWTGYIKRTQFNGIRSELYRMSNCWIIETASINLANAGYAFASDKLWHPLSYAGANCTRIFNSNLQQKLYVHRVVQKSKSLLNDIYKSHTRTVVRGCFKGEEASQWKRPKFDPSSHQNPLTDLYKNWQAWSCPGRHPACKIL